LEGEPANGAAFAADFSGTLSGDQARIGSVPQHQKPAIFQFFDTILQELILGLCALCTYRLAFAVTTSKSALVS